MASGRFSAAAEATIIKPAAAAKATMADDERLPALRQVAQHLKAVLLAPPTIILVHHSAEAK
jgi:hypothetical protein